MRIITEAGPADIERAFNWASGYVGAAVDKRIAAFERQEAANPLLTGHYRETFALEFAFANARKFRKTRGRLPKGDAYFPLYSFLMRHPSDEVVARLLAIDPDFFGRDFETPSGVSQLAREAWILPGLGGKHVIEMANRVVVPRAARASAQAVLARARAAVPLVCIEELA